MRVGTNQAKAGACQASVSKSIVRPDRLDQTGFITFVRFEVSRMIEKLSELGHVDLAELDCGARLVARTYYLHMRLAQDWI